MQTNTFHDSSTQNNTRAHETSRFISQMDTIFLLWTRRPTAHVQYIASGISTLHITVRDLW